MADVSSLFTTQEQEVFISGPDGQLQAITQLGREIADTKFDENQFVIVCHPHPLMQGTMNNKVVHTCCRAFRDLGVKTVRFNFRGVEKSEGSYAEGIGETDDLFAVIEWCKSLNPNAHFYLAGFSFGSFVATNAAQQFAQKGFELDGLIAVAPPVPRMGFANLLPLSVRTLVVMGEEDEVVEPVSVYDWCAQDPEHIQLEKVADTTHFFHGKLTQLKSLVTDFIN